MAGGAAEVDQAALGEDQRVFLGGLAIAGILAAILSTYTSANRQFGRFQLVGCADDAPAADAAPPFGENVQFRGSMDNSRVTFERGKKGTVAFIGGSITVAAPCRSANPS